MRWTRFGTLTLWLVALVALASVVAESPAAKLRSPGKAMGLNDWLN